MKKALILFLLFISVSLTYAQQLHSIRFVHIGPEDKPIGTLIISVEKIVKPKDRIGVDNTMGRSVKTDMRTFEKLIEFVRNYKHLTTKATNQPEFRIVINNASELYLETHSVHDFFADLLASMKKQKVDKIVIGKLSDLKRRFL